MDTVKTGTYLATITDAIGISASALASAAAQPNIPSKTASNRAIAKIRFMFHPPFDISIYLSKTVRSGIQLRRSAFPVGSASLAEIDVIDLLVGIGIRICGFIPHLIAVDKGI